MKKKLFGNNIKPSCKYCELGTAMGDDKIQCSKFGVVKSYDSCKKFVYSPLKRIPKKEIQLANSDVNNINFWCVKENNNFDTELVLNEFRIIYYTNSPEFLGVCFIIWLILNALCTKCNYFKQKNTLQFFCYGCIV